MVITSAQSIVDMFRDYFPKGDIPDDARALRLLVRPTDRKFAIDILSDSLTGPQPPLVANFDIKRIFSIGSGSDNNNSNPPSV
jgi:hypothetical protein